MAENTTVNGSAADALTPNITNETIVTEAIQQTIAERSRFTPNNGLLNESFVSVYGLKTTWAGISDEKLANMRGTATSVSVEYNDFELTEEQKRNNPNAKPTPNYHWATVTVTVDPDLAKNYPQALVEIDGIEHDLEYLKTSFTVDTQCRSTRVAIHWTADITESVIIDQK